VKKKFKPETLMMSYGYKPQLSEGALKCPIFQTSTFVFKTAEEGKAFFEVAYGHREKKPKEEMGLIYSRLNNPDLEILENRLTLWDGAEDAAVFESGLAAITTVLFEFLRPGQFILHSAPVYGGTDHFIKHVLSEFGIKSIQFTAADSKDKIVKQINKMNAAGKIGLIYVETPSNPTNALIDLEMCREIADEFSNETNKINLAVDNTYMGPLWQHPLKLGADLVIYSATKYLGGHSDLIAGACLGSKELITRVRTLRTFLGNMAGPWTGWLLMRSLETLKPRMELQAANAVKVAKFLCDHPKVEKIYYPGTLREGNPQYRIFRKQCTSPGAMLSFDVCGGEKEAFLFLNNLKIIKLAVSLGGTESLAEHPATMTHVDVSEEERDAMAITGKLIRLSVGIENVDDIIWDINQALECIC
jgi:methionine-gamma-lyase